MIKAGTSHDRDMIKAGTSHDGDMIKAGISHERHDQVVHIYTG